MSDDNTNLLFREVQRFRQVWLWALVIAVAGMVVYAAVQQLILGRQFGSNPAPDYALIIIFIIFGLGLPVLFYMLNLTVEIRSDGLYFRFFPLHRSFQKIALEELSSYEACTYSPVKEYGGWGIRYGSAGKAYNISGNKGLRIVLVNGQKILFGSQMAKELVDAIDMAKGKGKRGRKVVNV